MHKCIRSFVMMLGSLLLISLPSNAQQTLGAINGTVSDSTGAVLSKVEVKIRNLATNLEVTASTKDDGSFIATALPVGPYSVSFARDGFKLPDEREVVVAFLVSDYKDFDGLKHFTRFTLEIEGEAHDRRRLGTFPGDHAART